MSCELSFTTMSIAAIAVPIVVMTQNLNVYDAVRPAPDSHAVRNVMRRMLLGALQTLP